jgi:hypothetical protein
MKSEVEKQLDINPLRNLNTWFCSKVWQSDYENEETLIFV